MIQQKIKEIQGAMQKMQKPGQPMPFQPEGLMQAYAAMLNSFLTIAITT